METYLVNVIGRSYDQGDERDFCDNCGNELPQHHLVMIMDDDSRYLVCDWDCEEDFEERRN